LKNKKKNIIYGVNLDKKITPLMVRDAIIECFYQAHSDVLDLAREYFKCDSKDSFKTAKKEHVKDLIETIFSEIGGNYYKPKKKDLIHVIGKLRKIASVYREPDIIKKHVDEITQLIDRIE
jgi:hypothetical protein